MHIDDNQRHYHLFYVDLVYRTQAADKVSRRVNVRTPLADMRVLLGEETCAQGSWARRLVIVSVQQLALFIWEARPMWDAWSEGVCQVHEFLRADDMPG
jgi:hypothetical protein